MTTFTVGRGRLGAYSMARADEKNLACCTERAA
jgi:hypothetical protein